MMVVLFMFGSLTIYAVPLVEPLEQCYDSVGVVDGVTSDDCLSQAFVETFAQATPIVLAAFLGSLVVSTTYYRLKSRDCKINMTSASFYVLIIPMLVLATTYTLAFDMASVYPEPLEYCTDKVDVEDSTALEFCIIGHQNSIIILTYILPVLSSFSALTMMMYRRPEQNK